MSNVHAYDQRRLATFRLGETTYAVEITLIQEIIDIPVIRPIPRAPFYLEGIFNLRKTIIPIIDFRKLLGLDAGEKETAKVIIVSVRKQEIGFIVDEVAQVITISKHDILPPPPVLLQGLDPESMGGIFCLEEDENTILLNLDRILSPQEVAKLAQATTQAPQ